MPAKAKFQKITVPVTFTGEVEVEVPVRLSPKDALLLGTKLAMSRIVATTDNPDAPDEEAFDEYKDEVSKGARKMAGRDWDRSKPVGVGGAWSEVDKSSDPSPLDAITLIDISDTESMSVNSVVSFPNTGEGQAEARKLFEIWVKEAAGDNGDSLKKIEELWDAGRCEIGSGVIIVVSSS